MLRTAVSTELDPTSRALLKRFAGQAVRQDADSIGFVPWQFYDHHDAHGTLTCVTRNDDLVGFAAHAINPLYPEARILQIWVRPDARQIEHGRALLARVAADVAPRGVSYLRLWCAEDLEANAFWGRLSFRQCCRRLGRRRRQHLLWTAPLGILAAPCLP